MNTLPQPSPSVEAAAKLIYDTWKDLPEYRAWQDGGNSLKQDEARRIVRQVIELASPLVAPVGDAEKLWRRHLDRANRESWNAVTFDPRQMNKIVGEIDRLRSAATRAQGVEVVRAEPVADEEIIKAANIGAVHTERVGRVERRPEEYRQELQRSFLRGARWAFDRTAPAGTVPLSQGNRDQGHLAVAESGGVQARLAERKINAAAKALAQCMDYPWGHMPEPGRNRLRSHAQAIIEAAKEAS